MTLGGSVARLRTALSNEALLPTAGAAEAALLAVLAGRHCYRPPRQSAGR
jgi:hypothetical protein